MGRTAPAPRVAVPVTPSLLRAGLRTGLSAALLAGLVAGCAAGAAPAPVPTPSAPGDRPAPTDTPSDARADVAASDPAAALLAATREPLDAAVLPPGYDWVDSVEVDDGTDAVSNIYGGPDGPTGPTIWLHTGIGAGYTTSQQEGLVWADEPGSDGYTVRSAEGAGGWAFVDIDAAGAVDASVQLVAQGVPLDELRGVAARLLAGIGR